jgi:hypothetical protein
MSRQTRSTLAFAAFVAGLGAIGWILFLDRGGQSPIAAAKQLISSPAAATKKP